MHDRRVFRKQAPRVPRILTFPSGQVESVLFTSGLLEMEAGRQRLLLAPCGASSCPFLWLQTSPPWLFLSLPTSAQGLHLRENTNRATTPAPFSLCPVPSSVTSPSPSPAAAAHDSCSTVTCRGPCRLPLPRALLCPTALALAPPGLVSPRALQPCVHIAASPKPRDKCATCAPPVTRPALIIHALVPAASRPWEARPCQSFLCWSPFPQPSLPLPSHL